MSAWEAVQQEEIDGRLIQRWNVVRRSAPYEYEHAPVDFDNRRDAQVMVDFLNWKTRLPPPLVVTEPIMEARAVAADALLQAGDPIGARVLRVLGDLFEMLQRNETVRSRDVSYWLTGHSPSAESPRGDND